jgi:ankyrin repeat protein
MQSKWIVSGLLMALLSSSISAETLTDLIKAVQQGQRDRVQAMLEKQPELAKAADKRGQTALFKAVYLNRTEIANLLIARGSDVNAATARHTLPLHAACQRGSLELAKLLVLNRADVNVTDPGGRTPLHLAAGSGNPDIITLLVQQGASGKVRDLRGLTALQVAARKGNLSSVQSLLGGDSDLLVRDSAGRNLAQLAESSQVGDWKAIAAFLRAKAVERNQQTQFEGPVEEK